MTAASSHVMNSHPWPGEQAQAEGESIHLVGCCGSGMKNLADLLTDLGCRLSGSDLQPPSAGLNRRIAAGFRFHQGHEAVALPADATTVVYSRAIPAENPERRAAAARGIPELSYTQMLGRLMQSRAGVCIAGTHGKSTTTAMTAWILQQAGCHPSAIFGAELCDSGLGSWAGSGDLFVVESCEFQRSFLDLSPRYGAILSVEPDHFDCFHSPDDLTAAFGQFAAKVASDGFLLTRFDDAAAQAAAQEATAPVLTFGESCEADWWAGDVRQVPGGTRSRIFRRGQFLMELCLPVPGRHNVLNALAAAAICYELGVVPDEIRASLADFPGIRRRFERVGSWKGVTLIDDYAHHPTAVRETLRTARDLWPGRRLVVAFQPHQVSRTRALLGEFLDSLAAADVVVLAPVFAARESLTAEPLQLSRELAAGLENRGVSTQACISLDHLQQVVEDALKPGDVFFTMGAGDIDRIQHAFTRRLQRDSAAQRATGAPDLAENGRPGPVFPHATAT